MSENWTCNRCAQTNVDPETHICPDRVTPVPTITIPKAEYEAMKKVVEAAKVIDFGVPDNWPKECCLKTRERHDGSLYIAYYPYNQQGLPTIGDHLALSDALDALDAIQGMTPNRGRG